ncbi:DUF7507 domain-containing protein [Congregibacter sp.]|uniref:DUF7507 domain-containing protein n=1 Tax=Congregibacter sp. TaxID=2744308 RepID=UPI003F6CF3FA
MNGDSETDTVTVSAVDDNGQSLNNFAQATVVITAPALPPPPSLSVSKAVFPRQVKEPGGSALYGLRVTNTSASESVQVDTLVDDLYGDVFSLGSCSATAPVVLAPGEFILCAFIASVPPAGLAPGEPGDIVTDTITATGVGVTSGDPVTDSDSATVIIIDVPSSIQARKIAYPSERSAPGGVFTFGLAVQNTSPVDTVTLDSLVDDVYGDLDGQGSCAVPQILVPSAIYTCSFTGVFNGATDDTQVDTIAVLGTDDDGDPVSAFPRAQVTISSPPVPALEVQKTASPTHLPAPGGPVIFSIVVTNASNASTITLNSLVDDPYGDLDGQGTCATGAVLAPGAEYSCSFTTTVSGNEGDQLVDVVTASGQNGAGTPVQASDTAEVTLLNQRPPNGENIVVVKSASPNIVNAPGAPVEFTIQVQNNSVETLELTSLVDSVFGDLDGQGDCAVGSSFDAQTSYSCRFTANVNGSGPGLHINTVSAEASASGGPTLEDSDPAIVFIRRIVSTAQQAVPIPLSSILLTAFILLLLVVRQLRKTPR